MRAIGSERRRRLAVFAMAAVATIAVAGTSASPRPPPALSRETTGALSVNTDHPVATVEVSVAADAAIRGAPGGTEVRIDATPVTARPGPSADPAAGGAPAAVVVTVEALDGEPRVTQGIVAHFVHQFDQGCEAAAACTRRYRITAILTAPSADPLEISWSLAAETRFGPDSKSSAPPDGRLEVVAGQPTTSAADRLAVTAAGADEVRIDQAHPWTEITSEIVRPPDAPTLGAMPLLLLHVGATEAQANAIEPTGVAELEVGPATRAQVQLTGPVQTLVLPFPSDCAEASGCSLPLTIRFRWTAHDPARAIQTTWSLQGVSQAGDRQVPVPFVFGAPSTTAWTSDAPRLAASADGSVAIGPGKEGLFDVSIALDSTNAPRVAGPLTGLVRGTLTVQSTGAAAGRSRVEIDFDRGFDFGPPGERLTVAGELHRVACPVRVACSTDLGFIVRAGSQDPIASDVHWVLDAELLPDPGAVLPDGLVLVIRVTPRPAP